MYKKRKIRSLNRASKNIKRWKENTPEPNLYRIDETGEDYRKLWISPWSNLFIQEQPNRGHRNEILAAMLDVYENWHKVVKAHNPEYGVIIWLCYPNFMQSEIIATKHPKIRRFNESKENEPLIESPFSEENIIRLKEFKYRTNADEVHFLEEEFDEIMEDGKRMFKEKFIKDIKENYYNYGKNERVGYEWWTKKVGCVWELYKD